MTNPLTADEICEALKQDAHYDHCRGPRERCYCVRCRALRELLAVREELRLANIDAANNEADANELRAENAKLRAALQGLSDALDRCESNRGAFSCAEVHDLRCPLARGYGDCACGRKELDAACQAAREALGDG